MPVDRQVFLNDPRSARRKMVLKFPTPSASSNPTTSNLVEPMTTEPTSDDMEIDPTAVTAEPAASTSAASTSAASTSAASTSAASTSFGQMTLRSGQVVEKLSDERLRTYNTVPLSVAIEAERYKVRDRPTAAVATATLLDFRFITPDDKRFVIDRYKVRRARQKLRK